LHDEIHITTLFVTHDQEEALEVADRVAILRNGRIEQIGTPDEIYDHPASPFVYDFLGNVNLFSGRIKDGAVVISGTEIAASATAGEKDTDAIAFVRPHDVRITREAGGQKTFPAIILHCNAAGPVANLELERVNDGGQFSAQLSKEEFQQLQPKAGEQVYVELKKVKVFSDDYSI
jgi:sulfate transport system ATP-binding protein